MPLLRTQSQLRPGQIAIHMAADGSAITYSELDRRADAVARAFLALGLEVGDTVALLMENHLRCFELWWGARRAGLYFTPISTHLHHDEAGYLLHDSGARILIASVAQAELVKALLASPAALPTYMLDGILPGCAPWEPLVAAGVADETPLPERPVGREFLYSSGTTGRPKGIRRPLTPYAKRLDLPELERRLRGIFRLDPHTVFLSTSPLYHATGRFVVRVLECGGTAVVLDKFDAEAALAAIARHRVTHSHWVPTMFVRLLALPEAIRRAYDLNSLRLAVHAAAPCRSAVKEEMIAWWGPIIEEYYGGSENVGVTYIDSPQWLAHRGSVGRPIWGEVHIVDDEDDVCTTGEIGTVYFSGGVEFKYHNDEAKTAAVFNSRGWGTYGDVGHVDTDGYLYLSDRRADLILSGGVNLYPQEIENVLATHEAVADVVVVGVPNDEFGEEVKAVVHVREGWQPDPTLREALIDHCRSTLSRIKCPRSVDFVDAVPRTEAGKLLRRKVKALYW